MLDIVRFAMVDIHSTRDTSSQNLAIQTPEFAAALAMTADQYQARLDSLVRQGYRQTWIQGHGTDSGPALFNAIWIRDPDPPAWIADLDKPATEYLAAFKERAKADLRPRCISFYRSFGEYLFAAVWDGAAYGTVWIACDGADDANCRTVFEDLGRQGFRPELIEPERFPADTNGALDIDARKLHAENLLAAVHDRQPVVFCGYDTEAGTKFCAHWAKVNREFHRIGKSLLTPADTETIHKTIETFMAKRNIPNASLAIANDGKLKFAYGYHYASDHRAPSNELSLFRIASISKPITGAAIMNLVEDGLLDLNAPVFPFLGIHAEHPGQNDITIRHLLQHLGGWRIAADIDESMLRLGFELPNPEAAKWIDPMFLDDFVPTEHFPISQQQIIDFVVKRTLDHIPSTVYEYSNFGYCLLGRVIEQVTGKAYEDYCKEKILSPLGIVRTKVGSTLFEKKDPDEVHYFTRGAGLCPSVMGGPPRPEAMMAYGGFNLENMDSHGGWISSAADLVRFGSCFDDPATCKILRQDSVEMMFAPPPAPFPLAPDAKSWYACGWRVEIDANGRMMTRHAGSLPGTATELVRRHNNQGSRCTFSVLLNKRHPSADPPNDLPGFLEYQSNPDPNPDIDWNIRGIVEGLIDSISSWPDGNLFGQYYPHPQGM